MNKKSNPNIDKIRVFFSKIRVFFSIFEKKSRGSFPLSSTLVSRLWVWMNKHRYLWISLNILNNPSIILWLRWGSEYTWSSDMFDWLLKMRRVLNRLEFWSWHGCICKGYAEFSICLNMAQYDSVTTEYASMS